MSNQKMDGTTYITGVEKNDENEEIQKYNSSKDSPSASDKKNSKTIEHSDNKIISIVFPIVKSNYRNYRNNLPNLFNNYPNKIKSEISKNNHINKSYKNISVAISQMRNRRKELYHNYYINESLENESKNESMNNKSNNGGYIINNSMDKDKHESSNQKISNNINLKNKDYNKIKMNKRFKNLFKNDSSLNSKLLKEKLFGKEKPVLSMVENKPKFRPSLIEKYSKRLFYNKTLDNNNNENIEINRNGAGDDEYKIHTMTFHNKKINYVTKIDNRNADLCLPPIVIGSKFNSQNRSIERINNKANLEENDKLEKNKNVQRLTKKEILKMIKGRRLIKCNRQIVKATRNINKTSDKIRNIFNRLRISLNEYDDWNDPKNVDNLYDN